MPIVGWRRVSSGSGCGFCAMLESRGAVYKRERSAGFSAHDGCSCTAEPVWRREDEPPHVRDLQREWAEVTQGYYGRDKIKAWNKYWRQKQARERIGMEGLRDLAREKGVRGYRRMTKEELIKALDLSKRQQRRMRLDARPPEPTSPTLTSAAQRGLVGAIERVVEVAALSVEARRSVAAGIARDLDDELTTVAAPMLRALRDGTEQTIRDALEVVARAAGLRPIGAAGEVMRLPSTHVEWIGAGRAPVVQIIRPGWEDTTGRVLQRALVQAATPEQIAALSGRTPRGTLTMTQVSIQKAQEELAAQLDDVARLVGRGASARALIATMRARMRRLRLEPVDAAGNPLAGTSPTPAVRYVWRRPGGDVDMSGPRPTDWPPDELREWDLAKRMTDVALAVERTARTGRMGDVVEAAREAARM